MRRGEPAVDAVDQVLLADRRRHRLAERNQLEEVTRTGVPTVRALVHGDDRVVRRGDLPDGDVLVLIVRLVLLRRNRRRVRLAGLECAETRRLLADDADRGLLEQRPLGEQVGPLVDVAEVVLVVADVLGARAAVPRGELVRAEVPGELEFEQLLVLLEPLDVLLLDVRLEEVHRDRVQERVVRLGPQDVRRLQRRLELELAGLFDLDAVPTARRRGGRPVGLVELLDEVDEVLGGDLPVRLAELEVLAHVERPHLAVLGGHVVQQREVLLVLVERVPLIERAGDRVAGAVLRVKQRVQGGEPRGGDRVVGAADVRLALVPRGEVPAVREVLDRPLELGVVADDVVAEQEGDVRLLVREVLEDLDERLPERIDARRLPRLLEQLLRVELRVVADRVVERVRAVEEHLVRERVERVGVQPEHDGHVPRLVTGDRLRAGVLRRRVLPGDLLAVDGVGPALGLGGPVLVVEPRAVDGLDGDVDTEVLPELLSDEVGRQLRGLLTRAVVDVELDLVSVGVDHRVPVEAVVVLGLLEGALGQRVRDVSTVEVVDAEAGEVGEFEAFAAVGAVGAVGPVHAVGAVGPVRSVAAVAAVSGTAGERHCAGHAERGEPLSPADMPGIITILNVSPWHTM